jgi:hypothetical protein
LALISEFYWWADCQRVEEPHFDRRRREGQQNGKHLVVFDAEFTVARICFVLCREL